MDSGWLLFRELLDNVGCGEMRSTCMIRNEARTVIRQFRLHIICTQICHKQLHTLSTARRSYTMSCISFSHLSVIVNAHRLIHGSYGLYIHVTNFSIYTTASVLHALMYCAYVIQYWSSLIFLHYNTLVKHLLYVYMFNRV